MTTLVEQLRARALVLGADDQGSSELGTGLTNLGGFSTSDASSRSTEGLCNCAADRIEGLELELSSEKAINAAHVRSNNVLLEALDKAKKFNGCMDRVSPLSGKPLTTVVEDAAQALLDEEESQFAKGTANDLQIGGSHYGHQKTQPWDIVHMWDLDFFEGNVIKYVLRNKGDRVQDLRKAAHYLEKKLELLGER